MNNEDRKQLTYILDRLQSDLDYARKYVSDISKMDDLGANICMHALAGKGSDMNRTVWDFGIAVQQIWQEIKLREVAK